MKWLDKFIKPSTRAFYREARRTNHYSFWDGVHGYIYGRWIYFYISVGSGKHWLARAIRPLWNVLYRTTRPNGKKTSAAAKSFADGYHGKVVPLQQARELVHLNKPIVLQDLEKVIPYGRARDIVLKNPDHIVALECACRAAVENPCLPMDVCLVIGEPFASFILEHHPRRSRRITQQEADEILRSEHERGHVQHAFFKDAMFDRFYAICNCCPCCCAAMRAYQHGTPMLASSGFLAQVDDSCCSLCGVCTTRCPFDALQVEADRLQVDETRCMGCGVCVSVCPQQALQLVRDARKGEPLEIIELMQDS